MQQVLEALPCSKLLFDVCTCPQIMQGSLPGGVVSQNRRRETHQCNTGKLILSLALAPAVKLTL